MKTRRTNKALALLLSVLMLMSCVIAMPITGVSAAEGNEAAIGGTEYATLKDAIAAATGGDTITLLRDIEIAEEIIIDKDITLDGDNHTMYVTADETFRAGNYFIHVKSSFTMKDTTFIGQPMSNPNGNLTFGSSASANTGAFYLNGGKNKQIFENCTLTGFHTIGTGMIAYMNDPLTDGFDLVDGVKVPTDAGVYFIDTTITGNSTSGGSGGKYGVVRARSGAGSADTDGCATRFYVDGATYIKGNLDKDGKDAGLGYMYEGKPESGEDKRDLLYNTTRVIVKKGFTGYVTTTGYKSPVYDAETGAVTEASSVYFEDGVWTGKGIVASYGTHFAYPGKHGEALFRSSSHFVVGKTNADGTMTWRYHDPNNKDDTLTAAMNGLNTTDMTGDGATLAAQNIIVLFKDTTDGRTGDPGSEKRFCFTIEGHGHTITRVGAGGVPFFRANYNAPAGTRYESYLVFNNLTYDGDIDVADVGDGTVSVSITENRFWNGNQGAFLAINGGTLVLNGVTVQKVVQARPKSPNAGVGPVIWVQNNGSKIYATDLTVKDCYVSGSGSAMIVTNSASELHLAGNCTFEDNYYLTYNKDAATYTRGNRVDVQQGNTGKGNIYFEAGYTTTTPIYTSNLRGSGNAIGFVAEGVSLDKLAASVLDNTLCAVPNGTANADGYTAIKFGHPVFEATFTVKSNDNNKDVVTFKAQLEQGAALPALGCTWNEGATTFDKDVTTYVGTWADTSVEAVADNDGDGVFETAGALATLIAAGGTVELLGDNTVTAKTVVAKGVSVDGNGYSIKSGYAGRAYEFSGTGFTVEFKNVVFDGQGTTNREAAFTYWQQSSANTPGTLIYDNCTIQNFQTSADTSDKGSFARYNANIQLYLKDVQSINNTGAQGVIRFGFANGVYGVVYLEGDTNFDGVNQNYVYMNQATLAVSGNFTGSAVMQNAGASTNQIEGGSPEGNGTYKATVAEGAKITGTIRLYGKELYAYDNAGVLTWGPKGAVMCSFDFDGGVTTMESRAYMAGDALATPFKLVEGRVYTGSWTDAATGDAVTAITAGVTTYKAVYSDTVADVEAYSIGGEIGAVGNLSDVVANSSAGVTVEVLKDVATNVNININKSMTINGNDHTVTYGPAFKNVHLISVSNGGTVANINDLVIDGGSESDVKEWTESDSANAKVNSQLIRLVSSNMDVTFTNCSFINHRVYSTTETQGAAMSYAIGTNVYFKGETTVKNIISYGITGTTDKTWHKDHGTAAIRNNGDGSKGTGGFYGFEGKVYINDNYKVNFTTNEETGEPTMGYVSANYTAGSGSNKTGYKRTGITGDLLEGSKIVTDSHGFVANPGVKIANGAIGGNVYIVSQMTGEADEAIHTAFDGVTKGVIYGIAGAAVDYENSLSGGNLDTDKFTWNLYVKARGLSIKDGKIEVTVAGDKTRTVSYDVNALEHMTLDAAVEANNAYGYVIVPVVLSYTELAVDVTVQAYNNGVAVGDAKTYNARDSYLELLTDKADVAKAVLNFGGYLQTYANANTENMANANILNTADDLVSANDVSIAANQNASAERIEFVKSLTLAVKDDIVLRFYLKDDLDMTGVAFKLGDETLEVKSSANGKYVEIRNVPIRKLADKYTILMETNGVEAGEYSASIMSYVGKVLDANSSASDNMRNVCEALFHMYRLTAVAFDFAGNDFDTEVGSFDAVAGGEVGNSLKAQFEDTETGFGELI